MREMAYSGRSQEVFLKTGEKGGDMYLETQVGARF